MGLTYIPVPLLTMMRATVSSQIPSAWSMAVWGLGVVFLLAAVSPPLRACDGGIAVPDPGSNPGLVEDCKVLLALHDELVGTGSVNWDTQLAITSVCRQRKWDKMARCLRDTWGRCWSG